MKSDHWNFLANLLGTPSPAEPPRKEKEEKTKESASSEKQPPQAESPARPSDSDRERAQAPVAESARKPEPASGEDILDALSAAVPPQVLPGFGSAARDEEPAEAERSAPADREPRRAPRVEEVRGTQDRPTGSTAGSAPPPSSAEAETVEVGASDQEEPDEELDSAWGDLAAELGVEPAPAPLRQPSTAKAPESSASEKARPAKGGKPKRRESAFGSGLGLDDEEEAVDVSNQVEAIDEEEIIEAEELPGDWASSGPRRRGRSAEEPAQQRSEEGRRRHRDQDDRRSRDEFDSRSEVSAERADREIEGASDDDRSFDDEGESTPSRRRQRGGRRGVRQRMSDQDLDRSEPARDETAEAESRDRGRRRGERDDRSRGRGFREREEEEQQEPFGGELSTEEWREEREPSAADEEGTRTRSRRRGRRGRGRGRDRETERGSRIEHERPVDEALEQESAFDDDHEDDLEVEVIRRGQRARSRDRGRGADEAPEGRDRRRKRGEDEEARGGRPQRSPRETDREPEDELDAEGPAQRRAAIPTWIETIDLLVNANIENHKKSKGGRGRGGKRR